MNTINRRDFIKKSAVTSLGLGLMPMACKSKEKSEMPNILFIFPDQFRKQAMGFLQQDPVKTPNIDGIARNGVYFSHSVSNHPLCSPYRAMLLSGRYPHSTGVVTNCNSARTAYGNFLKSDEICVSDVLAQNGYNAGYVGKWHLNGPKPTKKGERVVWDDYCPLGKDRHGFDFWYSYGTDGNHNRPHYWINNAKRDEVKYFEKWSPEHEAEVIIDYIRNQKKQRDTKKPFAMFWSINPPHTPFNMVPDRYKKNFEGKTYKEVLNRPNVKETEKFSVREDGFGDGGVERKIHQAPDYFAQVEGVDDQIGRVIEELKKQGMYENTIIVFSADHGEMLGSHGLMHKNIWFKESFENPCLISWPKTISKRGSDDLLISTPDLMPTLLGLVGLKDKIPSQVEGTDFSEILLNKEIERPNESLYYFGDPINTKLQRRGIRTHKYTYIEAYDKEYKLHKFLYDDVIDVYQTKNIIGKDEKLDLKLHNQLIAKLKEIKDPFTELFDL
jgi:arylsulfatase A-like enzyme